MCLPLSQNSSPWTSPDPTFYAKGHLCSLPPRTTMQRSEDAHRSPVRFFFYMSHAQLAYFSAILPILTINSGHANICPHPSLRARIWMRDSLF